MPEGRQGHGRNGWGGSGVDGHSSRPAADDHSVWMIWVLTAWLVVATVAGVVLGRGIRLADSRSHDAVLTTADLPNFVAVG